ncbi:MAG TPA: beta-aspartyl-peptidase [Planctomycetaceae bacterium]|nr:beta-aspartyl-peptidase [Planctomycetaceae bacterium]
MVPVCLVSVFQTQVTQVQAQDKNAYSIVIHGGAGGDPGRWSAEYQQQRRESLGAALEVGIEMLEDGKSAIDVVEAVVRTMEDDPVFNAGRGCVLNEEGDHELDASIMDGATLRCGAVAAVTSAKHPVTLARKVMENTRHVLLMGSGADKFGKQIGVEQAPADWFVTDRKKASWKRWKAGQQDAMLHRPKNLGPGEEQLYLGTVGCVALDSQGNIAAATSTGGLMGKRWGRVGDSPIVGAGNYADNATCGVSGTGVGEEFIRIGVARDIAARMEYGGQSLEQAAAATVGKLPEDAGGVIAIDKHGNIATPFNTPGMSRAMANSSGLKSVALGREE